MIYLDNAATSNPKPSVVSEAMIPFITGESANPGRAGHQLANSAARTIFKTRELVAKLFEVENSENVVFTANISESLNLVLNGILKSGDHVIVSSMEHNSMMRPLRSLEKLGVQLAVIEANSQTGAVNPEDFRKEILPSTKLICLNHISNVCGTIQPAEEIGKIARESDILFLLDTAQSAGAMPFSMKSLNIDFLAFTGHKSLLGPMGIGGLVVGERVDLSQFTPLIEGGTGSLSEDEEQPRFMPDFLESGTPNLPGIAGLGASIEWILDRGIQSIEKHETKMATELYRELQDIPKISVIGHDEKSFGAVVSIVIDGEDNGEVGFRLDREFGIACRVGLHCSPTAHKTLGTFPEGTIRFGVGVFTTVDDIKAVVLALKEIVHS